MKIEVRPTCIVINDYTWGDAPKIENKFRVWNKATRTVTFEHVIYDEHARKLYLPRGISIRTLENTFEVKAHYQTTCDEYRVNLTQTLLKYGPKDDVQKETIRFLLGMDEYSYTKNASQMMLALNTGAGKTYLGIAYMAFMNIKGIVIASSTDWLKQWKNRILEHCNIDSKEVYTISGSPSIASLYKKKQDALDKIKVYLVTHSTLSSLASRQGWEAVGELFKYLGIGVKIFDEAHLYFGAMSHIDYFSNTYKTIYMTATPERGDEGDNKIFQLYFKNVPTINLFDPDKDPRTHYISIRYNSRMSPQDISNCGNFYGFNRMNYASMITKYPNFQKICHVVMDLISKMSGRILIFMASNEAIQAVYDWILENYPEYTYSVGIYTSLNKNKRSALNHKIILTTSISAGEALDVSDVFCSVQLAEPMKSRPKCRQRLGRTRIRGSYFIDVIDDSVHTIRKYYETNLIMYEEYAMDIKTLKFNDRQLDKVSKAILEERAKGVNPFIMGYKSLG